MQFLADCVGRLRPFARVRTHLVADCNDKWKNATSDILRNVTFFRANKFRNSEIISCS